MLKIGSKVNRCETPKRNVSIGFIINDELSKARTYDVYVNEGFLHLSEAIHSDAINFIPTFPDTRNPVNIWMLVYLVPATRAESGSRILDFRKLRGWLPHGSHPTPVKKKSIPGFTSWNNPRQSHAKRTDKYETPRNSLVCS